MIKPIEVFMTSPLLVTIQGTGGSMDIVSDHLDVICNLEHELAITVSILDTVSRLQRL